MRQIFGDIRWEMKAAVFFVFTLAFTFIGPFGSYQEMTLAPRFVYWTVLMLGVGFLMHIGITLALRNAALAATPQMVRVAIGATIAAIPGAAVVEFINEVFRPSGVHLATMILQWAQVSVIGTVIGAVEYIDWRRTPDTPPPPDLTPFHRRLPAELGTDIISISMQDHYARVTTTQGHHMILMRLGDVLDEIGPALGVQIHRSHWVAGHHLHRIDKAGSKHIATLSDDRTLPVSMTNLAAARAALS